MKRYRIVYDEAALGDLADIELWITTQAGAGIATGYTARLLRFCSRLSHFPQRGVARDEVRPGLRTIGFEKRVNIAFEVAGDRVVIVRLLYAGRQMAPPPS